MNALTATIKLQHENETQIEVAPTISLRLAHSSGYRWVNFNAGNGWEQLSFVLRRQAVRAAVGAVST